MPTPVRVILWPPGGGVMAIGELQWTMFDVPAVGTRYWHGRDPLVVRAVDRTAEPATVELEHAGDDWMNELRAGLPQGYWLEGGRDHGDGRWHFHLVQDGVERPIGMYFGDSLDQAIGEAVAGAHQREAQQP